MISRLRVKSRLRYSWWSLSWRILLAALTSDKSRLNHNYHIFPSRQDRIQIWETFYPKETKQSVDQILAQMSKKLFLLSFEIKSCHLLVHLWLHQITTNQKQLYHIFHKLWTIFCSSNLPRVKELKLMFIMIR